MARIKKIRRPGSPVGRVQKPNFWLKYGAEAGDPCAGGPSARLVSINNCSCSYTAPETNCTTQCRYEVRSECYTNPPNNFEWANEGGTVIGGGTLTDDFIIIEITSSANATVEFNVDVTDTVSGDTDFVEKVFTHVHTDETVAPFFKGPDINNVSFASDTPISTFDFSQVFGGYITSYALVGNWPAGLSIDNNGLLTGTPTGVAIYDGLTVEASGPGGTATTNPFTVTIYNATAESLTVSQVQAAVCSYNSGIGQTECVAPGIYTATPVGWTTPPDSWIWGISSTSVGITAQIVAGQGTDTVDVDVTGAADGSITLRCEASNTNGELASDLTQFFTSHTDTVEDIVFIGPNIGDLTMTVDVPFTLDTSTLFTGTITGYTLGGSWPGGFAIDENGVITGTTTSEAFYGNAFVRADNSVDFATSDIFDIYSIPAVPVFNGTIPLMVGTEGEPIAEYDASLHYQTGGAVSTYSLVDGQWLTIGASTGLINGTPPNDTDLIGAYVVGTNSQGSDNSNTFNVQVEAIISAPIFTGPVVIPAVQVDTAFSHDMSQYFSGDAVVSYALTNNGGQAWLSINTSTGELSGTTPAAPVTVSGVIVTATNTGGSTPTDAFGFEVEAGSVETDYILKVKTPADSTSFSMPHAGAGTYNYHVTWGDGDEDDVTSRTDPARTHVYATAGIYQINVSGVYPRNDNTDDYDSSSLIFSIDNLGDTGWAGSGYRAFAYMTICESFTAGHHVGSFDMHQGFMRKASGGTALTSVDLTGFQCNLSDNAANMFYDSEVLTSIDLTPLKAMPLTRCDSMFRGCTVLNDCNPAELTITNLTNAANMFNGSGSFTTSDYDAMLISWAAQSHQPNVTLGMDSATKYSAGAATTARQVLTDAGWTITDGGPV